jgi:hypothetical protein
MWRCVNLVRTDVLEECIASIFRAEKIRERGTTVSRRLQILHRNKQSISGCAPRESV